MNNLKLNLNRKNNILYLLEDIKLANFKLRFIID